MLTNFFKKRRLKRALQENGFSGGRMGMEWRGEQVQEYEFLLEYYSNRAVRDFSDYGSVYRYREEIIKAVEAEQAAGKLFHETISGRETAERITEKFTQIVKAAANVYESTQKA